MSDDKKRSFRTTVRILHRYIGFFLIGFTVVFALSGIVLVYRDTDLLKRETRVEKTVAPNLEASELGKALHLRKIKLTVNDGDLILFEGGEYNRKTGVAVYTEKRLPSLLDKCSKLHKSVSKSPTHWITVFFGALLCFLAVSSFWMLGSGSRNFRRNVAVTVAGFAAAIAALLIS